MGRKTEVVDPKQNSYTYIYDNMDRLVKETTPFDGSNHTIKTNDYDKNSNLIKTTTTINEPGKSPEYAVSYFTYDRMNNLIKQETKGGSRADSAVTYQYDTLGNITQFVTGSKAATYYAYYPQGLLKSIKDPLLNIESYKYDQSGNLKEKTDKNGNITTYQYDSLNNLTETSSQGSFVRAVYSPTGLKVREENDKIKTVNSYDEQGRLRTQIDESPLTGKIEKVYSYHLSNLRQSFLLNKNGASINKTEYAYDSLGRLNGVSENGGLVAQYSYASVIIGLSQESL